MLWVAELVPGASLFWVTQPAGVVDERFFRGQAARGFMKTRAINFYEQATFSDWCLGFFMLAPLALTLMWQFQGTFPVWWIGFAVGLLSYQRFSKPGLKGVAILGLLVMVGTGLLQHDLISANWTRPLMHALFFLLAVPAGMHFGHTSHPRC